MGTVPALTVAALWAVAVVWAVIDDFRDSNRPSGQQTAWIPACTEDRIEPTPNYLAQCNAILAADQTRKETP